MTLTESQYAGIIRGYEQLRDQNRHTLEERRNTVYAAIPQMSQLDREVSDTVMSRVRKLLSDDASSGEKEGLGDDFAAIAGKRQALLKNAGYPEDYLDPIYTCTRCRDTGYYLTKDGTRTKCHCFLNQEISLLYEQSNIRDAIAKENFSTLSYDYCQGEDLEHLERAVKKCLSFIKNFKDGYDNLLFYGTVGTGKSFLSGCVANELLKQGHSVIYFSATGFFEILARYSFDTKAKESLYNFYKDLYNYDLVIIDDLGTEMTNQFVTSQLFACLNERHLRKKATIISTNLNLEEIRDRYSDRIFSRLASSFTICKLTGPDVRMAKKNL